VDKRSPSIPLKWSTKSVSNHGSEQQTGAAISAAVGFGAEQGAYRALLVAEQGLPVALSAVASLLLGLRLVVVPMSGRFKGDKPKGKEKKKKKKKEQRKKQEEEGRRRRKKDKTGPEADEENSKCG
jgi:hypothetical protein